MNLFISRFHCSLALRLALIRCRASYNPQTNGPPMAGMQQIPFFQS